MRSNRFLVTAILLLLLLAARSPLYAFRGTAVKEAAGASADPISPACPLAPNRNGTCANYRWYNICTGYIWIIRDAPYDSEVGVRFGGPENPCVRPGNTVKRAITYYRGTVPSYGVLVTIFLDVDTNSDGCPDRMIAQDVGLDPGERWNCSNFNMAIPADGQSLIVRSRLGPNPFGASRPWPATDGPYTQTCDPVGAPRSFYYGTHGQNLCVPWINFSPTNRNDNFLTYLIIDGTPNATGLTTWGSIKSTYR